MYQAKLAEQAERYDGELGGHQGAGILGPSAAAHRGREQETKWRHRLRAWPGTWIREVGNFLWAPGAVGGPRPGNLTPLASSPADTSWPGGRGERVEELIVKWRLGGGRVPGRGRGRRWRVLSPGERSPGELLGHLGMWRTIGWGDGGRNTRHMGESSTRSCSAGAFQGNMAGGGGGFSPEARCGAVAVESHKGEFLRAEGSLGLWCRAVLAEGWGRTEWESLQFILERRPAEMLRSDFLSIGRHTLC